MNEIKKLTRDELVKALRCCEDEDCMRCPVAYQPGSLCRDDVDSQAADAIENLVTENASLHQIIDKQGTMNKQLADKVLEMDAELAKVTAERNAAVNALRIHGDCEDCGHFGSIYDCPEDLPDDDRQICEACGQNECPCRNCHHASWWTFAGAQKEA